MNRRRFISSAAALAATTVIRRPSKARAASRRYRACVIGATEHGDYGHNLHRLWALRDDIDVVGLADPHDQGREYYGKEAKAQRLYADYREMLAKEKPELVVVAPRWTVNHKEYLLACAEAGAHGIVEKPLAIDLAEADEIVRAIDAKGLKWAIAFNFRASPIVRHARQLVVEDGIIGRLLDVRARGKEDTRSGGEDLVVLGVHLFDLMRYFAGPPEWCEAEVLAGGRAVTPADVREATEPLGPVAGDTIHARYGFSGQTRGYFDSVAGAEGGAGRWGIDLYGTSGVLAIRMRPVPQVRRFASPKWTGDDATATWSTLPGEPKVDVGDGPVGHYKPIVDDLIEAIELDRKPFTGVDAGRDALEMCQAVFETRVAPGRVSLPLTNRDHPLVRWQAKAATK